MSENEAPENSDLKKDSTASAISDTKDTSSVSGGLPDKKLKADKSLKKSLPKWLKQVVTAVGCLIIIVAVVWGVWYKTGQHKASAPTNSSGPKVDVASLTPEQQYNYLARQGNYDGAEKVLDSQYSKANDTQSKTSTKVLQAYVAIQFKEYNDALNYANEAMSLNNNSPDAYLVLGEVYSGMGQKDKAKSYIEQAIAHLDKSLPQYPLVLQDYQKKLQAVGD